jgi:aspartyl-tRNA synthetase
MKRILSSETTKYLGKEIKVSGWVHSVRSHGKIIFIDLRDKEGLLQIVFIPKNKELYEIAKQLKPEWVISVEGKIQKRPKQMINPKIETGEIELLSEKLEVLSEAIVIWI